MPSPSVARSTRSPAAIWKIMRSLVAEDTVWHIPGREPLAGDHYGRDAVFEMFGQLVQGSEGTFTQELHDVVASDDHVVALTHATASRGVHSYDSQDAWVFHLRQDQIAEAWWRPEDLYAADEFWT
jgi:ketosteroid isomerase-like protein